MKGVVFEQPRVDRTGDQQVLDNSKDKKKKRRSNRRSKQNSSIPATSDSVNEICVETLEFLGTGSKSNCVALDEHEPLKASYVAFSSLPPMHINEQAALEDGIMQNQQVLSMDSGGGMLSKSWPEPIIGEESIQPCVDKDFLAYHSNESCVQRKYFAPHWTIEAVSAALEKGEVLRALFRVNAHNRLEAYCKIDGVQTDVLITGIVAQNRAVEGDVVLIKVDPVSLWTKMKGSAGTSNNAAPIDDCNLLPDAAEFVRDSCKGKNKVDRDFDSGTYKEDCLPIPEMRRDDKNGAYYGENVYREPVGPAGNSYVNGHCKPVFGSDRSFTGSTYQNEVINTIEKLCATISLFPSKRPTGRVVAILEKSARRDTVVGFLCVKQWVSGWEISKEDKQNRHQSSPGSRDYILLTPTDPKFPKMVVPVVSLPNCIKKRMEDGDATIGMELVAAQIVDWVEESVLPEAHVIQVFGRGGEIEPHIAAILFENAILPSDFSPESLTCVPHVPWEIPPEEVQSRKYLRNLCVFTIDPATATDLDDALSVEMLSDGVYRVGVHIADVSYFVLPETALDMEAQIRSTSVYLLQGKLPMLPSTLSENLGSLNPGVDRLTFSIFWDINVAGEVLDRWIGRTIIRSCCKLSYDHAQDIIDGLFDVESSDFPQLHGQFEISDVIKSVKNLYEIAKMLKNKRFSDGALSLESPNIVFLFDEDGIPYKSMLCGRKDSNFLVEEFMLLANRTAAEVITRAYPSSALLRRHPEPNLRKIRELEAFCTKHGLELDASSSGRLHHSLECMRQELKNDSVLFDILISYATRPMQLAAYFCSGDSKDTENDWGHYALAVPLYTHFTSPLRRYPDIVVHRTLIATIEAEEMFMKHKKALKNSTITRCFTGVFFDKEVAESVEAQEALSSAAAKHRVPQTEMLADVAAHCNERKLASRHVKDATNKLYMWALLKKKETLFSEARVLGLGPRFMSIYIHKLAIERRINYDEVDGLISEWLDSTSTLILHSCINRRFHRRGSPSKYRPLEEVALVVNPYDLINTQEPEYDIEPSVFPLTVRLLSTIPVVLHAVGGDDGPLDIGVRLYLSSYFK